MRSLRSLLPGCMTLLCLTSLVGHSAWARETWSQIGHVQVLEGPEKVWVFVEVVRITDYTEEPLLHLMSRHPDEEVVSRTAHTIDRLGNVTETAMARDTGPGFDPDLNPIFRLSDGFYQYAAGATGRPWKVYRWRGDRFSALDERESEKVKRALRRVAEAAPLFNALTEIEAITERQGWRNLHLHTVTKSLRMEGHPGETREETRGLAESPYLFVSEAHQIRIDAVGNDRLRGWRSLRPAAVVASALAKSRPWSRTLIEVETKGSRQEGNGDVRRKRGRS